MGFGQVGERPGGEFHRLLREVHHRRKKPEIPDAMDRGKANGRVSLRRSLWRLGKRDARVLAATWRIGNY